MNVEMQSCGLILDILLIYFYLRHEKVGLYSERIFRISIVVNTVCICLDILSIFGIMLSGTIPEFIIMSVCKLYLVSLLVSSYMAFLYTCSDIPHIRDNEAFNKIARIIMFLGCFFIVVLPVSYFREGRVVYSYGLSARATFILS